MLHVTVWASDPSIPQPVRDAVQTVLDAGQAVLIRSNCLGYFGNRTRTEMIESAGKQYLKDEYRLHPVAREENERYDYLARKPKPSEHLYLVTFTTVRNKRGTDWKTVVYGTTLKDARSRFDAMWRIHEVGQRPGPRHPFHISVKRL